VDRQELLPRLHGSVERIALLDFRLTCRTGLHIGAGKSSDLAGSDQPVLRDAAGRPLVPGSSLRGILRSGIEAFCRAVGLDRHFADPGPSPDGLAPELAAVLAPWRQLEPWERVFGAAAEISGGFSYASRLQISDAASADPAAIELRDGVGIHRDTRTAAEAIKFDLEVVAAGTRFSGTIRFKNPADFELGLLAQALWMLDSGALLLGGKSARGLGWVGVEVTAPRFIVAAQVLSGAAAPAAPAANREWGSVETMLQAPLASLQQLAREASAARRAKTKT
jgi:CRISPR/Cas system CSM-associated protein Csm3 (group 7 of RAMP superfamily)